MNYWLIEDERGNWYMYDVTVGAEAWTKDAQQAIRFADKRSAELVVEMQALHATATEHEDVPPTERDRQGR